jgi:8-oxo-dGTP pyrophosphatase MutT (NUDIX family)
MKIYEKSSGGIVFKKQNNSVQILLLERKNSKWETDYVLPKWHMEEWETAKQTALREISEETWLEVSQLEIVKFLSKINYNFIASHLEGSPLIDKDVYLFLVKYTGDAEPIAHGILLDESEPGEKFTGISWKSIDELSVIDMKPDIQAIIRKNLSLM